MGTQQPREIGSGIEITEHEPTGGVQIERYDPPAFKDSSTLVVPDESSMLELAEALVDELPEQEIVHAREAEQLRELKQVFGGDE
ncbi:hypothetical protein KM295_14250 [Natronomonas sp. F2-12]|uniref:Uncharacterized protein n=1 Tax=Natronomonas aquatica TaxID=2841590 RepID=A0A9R1CVQ8_9EURY|nr:hypothetical protein [Natronomonas aquatica]MCQ4334617.1 hypothetical protein [Natronomonas aquatica]